MKEFPKNATNQELFAPAMKIKDQEEADKYLEVLVRYGMSKGLNFVEANRIIKDKLGYFAGYYSRETRQRVEKLFDCSHPIFGKLPQSGK